VGQLLRGGREKRYEKGREGKEEGKETSRGREGKV